MSTTGILQTTNLSMMETKPTNGLLTDQLNLTNNRWAKNRPIWLTIDRSKLTNDWWQTLHESFSQYTIMAKLTNHVQQTRPISSSTDKHYSLDSENDFRSGCRNVSHQQQLFSELLSPRQSHSSNYWYSWVQTIYCSTISTTHWMGF